MRELVERTFGALPAPASRPSTEPPAVVAAACRSGSRISSRATSASAPSSYPQNHDDRYAAYVLNTMLGGSMSSRLFQNVRERRGLAYAVFSNLSAYRDAGSLTIYAGCADEAVREVVEVVVEELRGMKVAPPDAELRRAKDHLKGSLMLSLESTSSRMSNLARQEMYFDRQFGLDETIEGIERVTAEDVVASRATCSPTDRSAPRCWATGRPGALASPAGSGSCRMRSIDAHFRLHFIDFALRTSH